MSPRLFAGTPAYERLDNACTPCVEIDKLLSKHSTELDARKQALVALNTGLVIKKIRLAGKSEVEQKRLIYFSLKGCVEVMLDDFDHESILGLIDLRTQSPKIFDSVFWTFPKVNQQDIVLRMGAMMDRKLRKKTKLPEIKELEN